MIGRVRGTGSRNLDAARACRGPTSVQSTGRHVRGGEETRETAHYLSRRDETSMPRTSIDCHSAVRLQSSGVWRDLQTAQAGSYGSTSTLD